MTSAADSVEAVAVVGGGLMGRGIAIACLDAGLRTVLIEVDRAAAEHADGLVRSHYARLVERDRLAADERAARLERFAVSASIARAAPADLVIEACPEDLSAKQAIFRALGEVCDREAILASNTSSLDIDRLAAEVPNPGRVVGLHFFSPAPIMRLLEIVRGCRTNDATIATSLAMAERLDKSAVVVGVGPGFVANRTLAAYLRQATLLLEDGAVPEAVDAAIRSFGFAMGPFAVYDFSGIDVAWSMQRHHPTLGDTAGRPSPLLARLVEAGRLGQKTGAGWYRYEPGSRVPVPDAEVLDLVAARSRERGVARRQIDVAEIVTRCLHAIVNEACGTMDDGLVGRGEDIDVIWMDGFGFPRAVGGPLAWADRVGLQTLCAEMQTMAPISGAGPAPLLVRLARDRLSLSRWSREA